MLFPGSEIPVGISRSSHTPVYLIRQIDIDPAKGVDDPYEGLQVYGHVMIHRGAKVAFQCQRQQTGSLPLTLIVFVARVTVEKRLVELSVRDAAVIRNL